MPNILNAGSTCKTEIQEMINDSITGKPTITVGPVGSGGDYICDGTDDQVQIQAAIDSIATIPEVIIKHPDGSPYTGVSSRGEVVCLRGAYSINDSITLKSSVHLNLTENAYLYPVADVDMVIMQNGSCIDGRGSLYAQGYDNYSKNLILLDSLQKFSGMTHIRDISLAGGANQLCTGIHLYAVDAWEGNFIYGVQLSHLYMTSMGCGIKMTMGGDSWIACTDCSDITIMNPLLGIGIYSDPGVGKRGAYNNSFNGVNIELGNAANAVGIYCEGWQNSFDPIFIWDTNVATGTALNFTNRAVSNRIAGRLGAPIINNGTNNVITDWES